MILRMAAQVLTTIGVNNSDNGGEERWGQTGEHAASLFVSSRATVS